MSKKRLSNSTILSFTTTMSALLSSSLSIQDALIIAEESESDKKTKAFTHDVYKRVKSGKSLTDSLSYYKKFIPSVYLMLISIAERTGMVKEVFEKLQNFLKEKKERKQKIIEAVWYPALVFIAMICVLFVIITFVFPRMEGIFEALGDGNSGYSDTFSSLTNGLKTFVFVLSVLILFGVIVALLYRYNKNIKYTLDKFIYKIPFIKNIRTSFDICDFCFAMKLLLSSSVPADDAVELSSHGVKNLYFKECINKVNENIKKGLSFKESFDGVKVFPSYFITWLSINETSSDMGETFQNLYGYYKNKTDNMLTMVAKSLEPIMTMITGLFVIIFVIKFIVPMFDMLGSVG